MIVESEYYDKLYKLARFGCICIIEYIHNVKKSVNDYFYSIDR